MNLKEKMSEKSGITLITLVVTIIILLILAGITIATITSDNGIIKKANDAKEQNEIAEEKEIVDRATVQVMGKNKYGNIDEEELQDELNKITNDGKTEVSDNGEEFEVIFIDSNRYYVVDRNGNIGEQGEILTDKSLGNIALGVNGETLPENEYQIWSIEDLVILSNISRGKGNYIENGEIKNTTQNNFSGCTIKLMRSLNFNSKLSYTDLSIGWSYDDVNEAYIIDETSTQNLRDLLIDKNGVGFIPISSTNYAFRGIFDGQRYEIQNLYQNTNIGGLFCRIYVGSVKNLGLVNIDITGTGDTVGGIVGNANNCKFYNIYVSGNLKGHGGISGGACQDITLVNCCNLANIVGDRFEGGLIGYADNTAKINIVNCYNMGKVTVNVPTTGSYHSIGGILGRAYCSTINITNCCSIGTLVKVNSSPYKNFYNICHTVGDVTIQLERCYYLDTSIDESSIAINENSISFSKNDASDIIESLNEYVENHRDEYKADYEVELYKWKLNADGLPVFEK